MQNTKTHISPITLQINPLERSVGPAGGPLRQWGRRLAPGTVLRYRTVGSRCGTTYGTSSTYGSK